MGRYITGVERTYWIEDTVQRYNRGDPIRKISRETGRSYSFVRNLLIEADVVLRRRGGGNNRRGV